MTTATAPQKEAHHTDTSFNEVYEPAHVWHEAPKNEPKQKRENLPKELVFNRSEKKYLISHEAAESFIQQLGTQMVEDERGSTIIRNLYLDTPDYLLIRRSIEKPLYKEKLRIRTYGAVAGPDHEAFVEIKKKFDGQVYKRRLALPLYQASQFIKGCLTPQGQIARELAWTIKHYQPLEPAISVIYKRCAYTYPGLEGNVRITFDYDLAAKPGSNNDFYQSLNAEGYELLLPYNHCVMEIKVLGAIPLELVDILSREELYPTSFSKVGTAYKHFFVEH